MIQQPSGALVTGNRHIIHHILPGKHIPLRLDSRDILPRRVLLSLDVRHSTAFLVMALSSETLGHTPASENQHLGGATDIAVHLHRQEVQGHEADQEANQDTKVPPHVAVEIPIRHGNESIAADGLPPSNSTSSRTDPRAELLAARKTRVRRDSVGAHKLLAVEFIGDDDLEGVVHGVDPADPAKPGVHFRDSDDESRVHDQGDGHHARDSHGLADGFGDGCDGPEHGAHDKGGYV